MNILKAQKIITNLIELNRQFSIFFDKIDNAKEKTRIADTATDDFRNTYHSDIANHKTELSNLQSEASIIRTRLAGHTTNNSSATISQSEKEIWTFYKKSTDVIAKFYSYERKYRGLIRAIESLTEVELENTDHIESLPEPTLIPHSQIDEIIKEITKKHTTHELPQHIINDLNEELAMAIDNSYTTAEINLRKNITITAQEKKDSSLQMLHDAINQGNDSLVASIVDGDERYATLVYSRDENQDTFLMQALRSQKNTANIVSSLIPGFELTQTALTRLLVYANRNVNCNPLVIAALHGNMEALRQGVKTSTVHLGTKKSLSFQCVINKAIEKTIDRLEKIDSSEHQYYNIPDIIKSLKYGLDTGTRPSVNAVKQPLRFDILKEKHDQFQKILGMSLETFQALFDSVERRKVWQDRAGRVCNSHSLTARDCLIACCLFLKYNEKAFAVENMQLTQGVAHFIWIHMRLMVKSNWNELSQTQSRDFSSSSSYTSTFFESKHQREVVFQSSRDNNEDSCMQLEETRGSPKIG